MTLPLLDLLRPERLCEVVDIGANPIDGDPPYKALLAAEACRVTGFEPQLLALSDLLRRKGPLERYLPYAVGDGRAHTLRVCRASGMTSLFEPDPAALDLFEVLKPYGEVIERVPVTTSRLDDVAEVERIDFLKMDIQGGELAVLQSGRAKLKGAVAVQTEVSFVKLYQDQPGLGEIDLELRAQGFMPHAFADVKRWPIAPCIVNNNPRQALNQLLEADMVYVRDIAREDLASDEQLKHLALVAHVCYGSWDLAMRCVMLLERRGALPVGAERTYVGLLKGA